MILKKTKNALLLNGSKKESEISYEAEKVSRLEAHGWTQGQMLLGRLTSLMVWLLVAAGPISLGLTLIQNNADEPVVVQEFIDPAQAQRISQWSSHFMQVYLTAVKGEEHLVSELMSKSASRSFSLPTQRYMIGSLIPGEATKINDSKWLVTVAVEEVDSNSVGVLRWWQVPVLVDPNGALVAESFPSLIAAPRKGMAEVSRRDPITDVEIKTLISNLMTAYLVGNGDMSPLLAPGINLLAVEPSPFLEVSLAEVTTSDTVPPAPQNGDILSIFCVLAGTDANGNRTYLHYQVEITYRDRWEVSAINPI